ncbi:carcinoembryonic antigen-related cell adhesion molecule 1-like [Micropterus salmoides]|uniref:carcinoembryonic antigen-related cell adhesion molecule 1-like n=1 Tax=Micropterus salmoides TaxID=27706 RepID=UPI0018ECE9E1|nr:carcinoembryonic antigen-related cell adhesion molecule 1-like [Micropterus salmoides]
MSSARRRRCTTMTRRLAALILLSTIYLIQTAEVPRQISLTVVELGDNFTFRCLVSETDGKYFYWYKQSLGYMVQMIAGVILGKITVSDQFKDSGFTVTKADTQYCLTIRNVSKNDEATYFCQNGQSYSQTFINGIFLAVNDPNQQKSVMVKQSPETASVQPRGSVTIQCSLLSKNKGNTDQCPEEHSVYWFRAGSGESHPNIIYSQNNTSDEQVEKSCVYSLSKTIQSPSDAGTYYCAVVTCGEILFGEGTKVDTRNVPDSGSELARVVVMLGVVLACCVMVIVVLIFYMNRRKVCEHCKGAMSDSHHLGHDRSTVDQSNYLDVEEKEVKYSALDFSTRKMKRGMKKGELSQECAYSVVRAGYHNQQHPSL